ncbi:MAG: hypothetical protein AAB488_02115 [Patescibacteria group bacterium]
MGIHEQFPQGAPLPENEWMLNNLNKEPEEDISPENSWKFFHHGEWIVELDTEQELINKLISKIKDPGTLQSQRAEQISQLEEVKSKLGKMRTVALKEGGMIEITDRMKEILSQVNETLKSVAN